MTFRFEELEIWQLGIKYANTIYLITRTFPHEELFGLQNQLRRCVTSISANIAEGSGSSSKKDFCHYLDIAIKSVYESVSHLQIAKDQGYINEEERLQLYLEADKLSRKIRAFQSYLLKSS